MGDSHANRFATERKFILGLLLTLAAGSWAVLVWQCTAESDMTSASAPMTMRAPVFFVFWMTMMLAMMLPSATPMVLSFHRVSYNQHQRSVTFVLTFVFVTAYILIWTVAGIPGYVALRVFTEHATLSPATAARLGGAVLVAAGLYQLTPIKTLCLTKCRTPTAFIISSSRGDGVPESLRLGLLHGAYCLGCCWALFAILFPLGMSNVAAMAALTLIIFAEKTLPWPRLAPYAAAFALVLYGALVITSPQLLPTYGGRRGVAMPAEIQMKTPGSASESKSPPESEVRLRKASGWERYRWLILLILTALSAQIALLLLLRHERRRRIQAEIATAAVAHELSQPLTAILANSEAAAGLLTWATNNTERHQTLSDSQRDKLSQPLTAILVNSEAATTLLASWATSHTELQQILSDIRRDDERAIGLIRRLRTVLRKAPFERTDNDLNEIVRETITLFPRLTRSQELHLRSEIALGELRIQGDRVQLQEVFINLIMNAMDAISAAPPDKRVITVRTMRVGNYAEVAVSDTGPGIPVNKAEIVFQPFFTTKPQGMGMGLFVSRAIVEAHGGRIWTRNLPGAGALFRLRLPLSSTEGANTP